MQYYINSINCEVDLIFKQTGTPNLQERFGFYFKKQYYFKQKKIIPNKKLLKINSERILFSGKCVRVTVWYTFECNSTGLFHIC